MSITQNGAQLLVACLVKQGVEVIYAIPGAKIDAVFDALVDAPIKVIICRHEQNAAFMAGAYGRLTGKPGVALVTSGPGVSNLATGLLTANTERDPIVAIGGNVPRNMKLKASHQNTDNIKLMEAVTKAQMEVLSVENIPEIIENAFRIAAAPHSGAVFISLPQDLALESTVQVAPDPVPPVLLGAAVSIEQAAHLINSAKNPALLLGQESSRSDNCLAVRAFIRKSHIPVTSTFQAAGVVSRELLEFFVGRVGLVKNQPGDRLLNDADLIIAIGFNRVEYDPELWFKDMGKKLLHIDYQPADIGLAYRPSLELIGNIAPTLDLLTLAVKQRPFERSSEFNALHDELLAKIATGPSYQTMPIHPLRFIHDLRQALDDESIVIADIGSHYMWLARYFLCFEPHHLLFSNGQQTLGVALPWAISAKLLYPQKTIVSVSGDGGFLFSAMELETAVRERLHIVHFIWVDGSYDMVKEQQLMKYHRGSAVKLGAIDIVQFASSFGAKGLRVTSAEQLLPVIREALASEGPVLVEIPIDYRDNPDLFKMP